MAKRIFILFFLAVLISCNGNEEKQFTGLSEAEQALIINEGYGNYCDSVGQLRAVFCRYAILDDTLVMDNLISNLEGRTEKIVYPSNNIIYGAYLEDTINHSNFPKFEFFTSHFADSVSRTWNTSNHSVLTPFAITRPYQPDSSNLAVIQEYPIPYEPGCFPTRYYSLIFKKIKGKWKLIDRIY